MSTRERPAGRGRGNADDTVEAAAIEIYELLVGAGWEPSSAGVLAMVAVGLPRSEGRWADQVSHGVEERRRIQDRRRAGRRRVA